MSITSSFPATAAVGNTGSATITLTATGDQPAFPINPATAPNSFIAACVSPAPPQSGCGSIGSPFDSGIVVAPSCGQAAVSSLAAPTCTVADPGVFTISPTANGVGGSTCQGTLFDVTTLDATTGTLKFTPRPTGNYVLLGSPGTSCVITFTYTVAKVPTVDADPNTAGIQTRSLTDVGGWYHVDARKTPAPLRNVGAGVTTFAAPVCTPPATGTPPNCVTPTPVPTCAPPSPAGTPVPTAPATCATTTPTPVPTCAPPSPAGTPVPTAPATCATTTPTPVPTCGPPSAPGTPVPAAPGTCATTTTTPTPAPTCAPPNPAGTPVPTPPATCVSVPTPTPTPTTTPPAKCRGGLVGTPPNCHPPITPSERTSARINKIDACQDSTFSAIVTVANPRLVKNIVFRLNGRRVKTLTKRDKGSIGVFTLRLNATRLAARPNYRLTATVHLKKAGTFGKAGTAIRSRTLRALTFEASRSCDPPINTGRR